MKNLLNPRFEVIAEYPNMLFKKNDILEFPENMTNSDLQVKPFCWQTKPSISLKKADKYPHLFKKLNWWEHRKVEEMPKYLVQTIEERKDVYKIKTWDMKNGIGITKDRIYCNLNFWKRNQCYFPSNKEDYERCNS